MNTSFILLLSSLILFSCQTSRHNFESKYSGRKLASSSTFVKWIERLAARSGRSQVEIEQSIISFIQKREPNNTFGNHVALGLTDDQARKITNLSSDLPFMDKVRKWSMENITQVNKTITREIAHEVYDTVVSKSRGVSNPYKLASTGSKSNSPLRNFQQTSSPFQSITNKQIRILDDIKELKGVKPATKKLYKESLAEFQTRGKNQPAILANGQEIIESATLVSRKTGHAGMGKGCKEFTSNASQEVLEIKSNIDIYRAQLIEEAAYKKAGRKFASIDEITDSSKHLTTDELDKYTMQAFKDVLGYTDDQASRAVKRLKGAPCNLY